MAMEPTNSEPPAVADRVSLLTFAEEHAPLLIGLAVAVVIYLLYKNSQSSTTSTTSQQDLSGLATNANGQPIVYVPTSTTFSTNNSINNSDNNSPTTTTTTTGVPELPPTGTTGTGPVRQPGPIAPKPIASIVLPAPRGSLQPPLAAGHGDTNFQIHTVKAGETLASITQKIGWGSDTQKLVGYRNNAAILAAALIDTSNPYASLPAGLQLST